jgi:hypothetical protein
MVPCVPLEITFRNVVPSKNSHAETLFLTVISRETKENPIFHEFVSKI